MVVAGYDEPRPRSYSMWKVSEGDLKTVVEDNCIDYILSDEECQIILNV